MVTPRPYRVALGKAWTLWRVQRGCLFSRRHVYQMAQSRPFIGVGLRCQCGYDPRGASRRSVRQTLLVLLGPAMDVLAPCARCDRIRQHLIVARLSTTEASVCHCRGCGAALVPVTRDVSRSGGESASGEAPQECPCSARGPVTLVATVLPPARGLWLCEACGLARPRSN